MKKIPGFTIRKARVKDIECLNTLEENFSAEEGWNLGEIDDYLKKSTRSKKTPLMIAFEKAARGGGPVPAGYCLGEMNGRRTGEICSLVVDKAFRGRGLGAELLDRVCKSLRDAGAQSIILQVKADNATAIHLYKGAGFKRVKVLYGYYDGIDGVEMRWSHKCHVAPK